MDYVIPCDVYARLANVTRGGWNAPRLKCVRLEYRNGKYFAIATNAKMAAIQLLGDTDKPNGFVHLVVDEALLKQAIIEAPFMGQIIVSHFPELNYATAKTIMGYVHTANAVTPEHSRELDAWHNLIPADMPKKPNGAMFWDSDMLLDLAKSSPTGRITFPEFIDIKQPVVLRDVNDDTWLGLMMTGRRRDNDEPMENPPASIPEWCK